ncbi:MAG TPA: hypothetical protein VFH54_19460 [Mycobacteriales bacterium]|nr:hypothetical protein [Mycobacteriales bacterium]
MTVSPLPARGGVLPDRRGAGRAMRVSAHVDQGFVTLSIWRDDVCVATHQLGAEDVPALIETLARTLVPPPGYRAKAVS